MKKLILAALLMTATVASYGQGILIFANGSTNNIFNGVSGLPSYGTNDLNTIDTQVGLYIGNVGDSVGSLTLITQTNCANPGRFAGGTRTLVGWNPGLVQVQVRAWLAGTIYGSYEAAVAGGLGGDATVLMGVSNPFNMTLVGVGTPPNSTATSGLQAFSINPVPEPSSIALGLLGLSAVALFRRRK
jgi:hypothetical protein